MRGKLIVVEGLDGSGKSTQVDLLIENVQSMGEFMFYKNISTSPLGLAIREITKNHSFDNFMHDNVGVACMYLAELALVCKNVEDALNRGVNIIMDRYYYSTMAYVGHSLEDGIVIETIVKDFIKPDLVIYLDAPLEVCLNRMMERNMQSEFFEKEEKLKVIKDNYDSIFKQGDVFDKSPCLIIDSTKKIHDIQETIVNYIKSMLEN